MPLGMALAPSGGPEALLQHSERDRAFASSAVTNETVPQIVS
jgi:hypothetical protein